MIWRDWLDLGGSLQGTPAIAGWTSRSVQFAVRGLNGNVFVGWRDEDGWGIWQDIGLPGSGAPAITRVRGSLWIFARGPDDHLWVGGPSEARDLGGDVRSAPCVAQWRLDGDAHVFVRNTDNSVAHLAWSPGNSGRWQNIGGSVDGDPAAVAWGPNRIDLFARGLAPAHLVHCSWDGASWSPWQEVPGSGLLSSFPCVVSRDIGRLEVYFGDDQGLLATRSFDGNQWSATTRLGPSFGKTPTAFSFAPSHVEVIGISQSGALQRLYQEGARDGDDPSQSASNDGPFISAPSSVGMATTTLHCIARGKNNHLQHIVYEDGFWGSWRELDGPPANGNPAAASPIPGVLDVVVQGGDQSVFRRRLTEGAWGPWVDTGMSTDDDLAVAVVSNATRIVARGPDDLPYEGVLFADGTSTGIGWSDPTGAVRITSAPHLVVVDADELAAPDPSLNPAVAIEAGTYLFALDGEGETVVTQLDAIEPGQVPRDFFNWKSFGSGDIKRPINFAWPLGFPQVYVGNAVGTASQAGWIGNTVSGDIQATAMYWQDFNAGYAQGTSFVETPWTELPAPWSGLAADMVGKTMFEPFDPMPGEAPTNPTLWLFGREPDGLLLCARFQQLVPASTLDWQFFGGPADGQPALLVLWERFEDANLFHAVLVTSDGRLEARRGGTFPEPLRIRPRPSSSGRLWPRPSPVPHDLAGAPFHRLV